jgi:hypothetical protein
MRFRQWRDILLSSKITTRPEPEAKPDKRAFERVVEYYGENELRCAITHD